MKENYIKLSLNQSNLPKIAPEGRDFWGRICFSFLKTKKQKLFRVFRGCDLPETLSEPDQLKSCNAKFLRGMFEVPECDVFLCTGSSGDRKNAKFDQFGQERRNFGVLGLVTRVMQV
mgnify:CR=1 FL=1